MTASPSSPWKTLLATHRRTVRIGGAGLVLLVVFAVVWVARGGRQPASHRDFTVEQLVAQAEAGLAALEKQGPNPKARRPAVFDAVLRPVDMLLGKAKEALQDATELDAPDDAAERLKRFNAVVLCATHARDLAARGQALAFTLSNPNNPTVFRFPEQRAEASVFLATERWARLRIQFAREFDAEPNYQPEAALLAPILKEIELGQAATQRNKELAYLEGTVKLVAADFAGAADAFRRAIQLDAQYGAAYAGLGKAYIELGQYDRAEKTYLDQILVGQKDAAAGRGPDTLRDALFNAASFHDAMAEGVLAGEPTDADRAEADRHARAAVDCYRRFLQTAGADADPARQSVRERLSRLSGGGE